MGSGTKSCGRRGGEGCGRGGDCDGECAMGDHGGGCGVWYGVIGDHGGACGVG